MNRWHKHQGYAVAIVATGLILWLRFALGGILGDQAPLLPFILAVIAAAWRGGLGPGMLATVLGAYLGLYFFIPPDLSAWIETLTDAISVTFFLINGATISLLCEALHRSGRSDTEKRFRLLADSIPQLVWMARPDGYRFWFNQRWYEYTGFAPGELEGWGWQRVHEPGELRRVVESWGAAVQTGRPWEETYPLRRHDGVVRWHLARALPVRDERGAILCWFGTNTDISERLETERALEDANGRKDAFLATLAHELRNPLSPISNAVQLWPFVENDREEMARLRGVIGRQVQQMTRLIEDLMDVSRISRGKVTLVAEVVEVAAWIDGAVEAAGPLIEARGHRLLIDVATPGMHVSGDPIRLTQVLANILTNAAKYTDRGGTITLSAKGRGDRVVVSVRDNGRGIPPPLLQEVFGMFRQVDETLERSAGGLGIGLTLVKQLVELHGGTVEAKSEGLGHGSEFVVTLPRVAAPAAAQNGRHDRAPAALPRRHVLVVDDVRESAETLAKMLRAIGQDAQAVFDGQTAVEWIAEHRPDVAILDIAMPDVDGYEVVRRVRRDKRCDRTVLVALTGFGQKEDRSRAFDAGFDCHLTKPVSLAALEQLLGRLERERKENPAPAIV